MLAQVAGAYRVHWRALLVAGLLVFVPLGLLEVVDDGLQEPLSDADLDQIDAGLLAAAIAAAIGHAVGALLGEVVYAGIVSSVVTSARDGRPQGLTELLRHLPLRRLIAVDLLWVAIVAVGLIALIVPGLVFVVWFALVAPAVEVEGRGVVGAFGRSRELVRRRFWLVAGLLLPILLLEDALVSAIQSLSLWGLGEGFAGDWVGSVLGNLAAAPPYSLAAVFLFLGLRERYPRSAQTASR